MGDLKNGTIFMDIIFVSSLRQNVQINSGLSTMTMKIQYKCGKRYLAKAGSKKLSLFTKNSDIQKVSTVVHCCFIAGALT